MSTLTVSGTTVVLPDDLYWADEFEWNPVEQKMDRTLTGGFTLQVAERDGGRPITLRPENNDTWVSRAVLDQLRAWAAIPGQQMTLVLRGISRTVVFRFHEGSGLEAAPVVHYSDIDAADNYVVSLRLLEL